MSAATLNHRLVKGAVPGDVSKLVDNWQMVQIGIKLPGMGGFVQAPSLGNKIRGALGNALLESASMAVRARRPCDWPSTCTAEYFFGRRPLIRLGDHDSEISRPFVLAFSEETDGSLQVAMSVFGLACARAASAADAMCSALRMKVKWKDLQRDGQHFLPGSIEPVTVEFNQSPLRVESVNDADAKIRLTFLTPVDKERGDLEAVPQLFFERLLRRLALVAPWHGVDLSSIYDQLLLEAENAVVLSCAPTSRVPQTRGGHRFANRLSPPLEMILDQVGPNLLHLIQLGQLVHVGRGANLGLGRFRIETL